MCGIVVYYGDGENPLSRVLSGMWAIVYRAPDSTGIGLAGSDLEPVKIRRELGSVSNLVDRLIDVPVFDEAELRIVSSMTDIQPEFADFIVENQKSLLVFEGFSGADRSFPARGDGYPDWAALTDPRHVLEIEPGTPGNPDIQERVAIDSPRSFRAAIEKMTMDLDLPLIVIEKLFERSLVEQIRYQEENGTLPVAAADLIKEFREVFDSYAHDETPAQPRRTAHHAGTPPLYVRKYLWQCLKQTTVIIPSDYTTDGIANLFRRIDGAVLAGWAFNPAMDEKIQIIFENFWKMNKSTQPVHWRSLYRSERLYNLYGLAAASALAFFQTDTYMKAMLETTEKNDLPPGHIPGRTNPSLLQFMSSPVIAQGRWAIQSSISVKNAHPFLDENKLRAVVLNGQFHSRTESRVKSYLTQVAGIRPRSDNTTELFSLLWGFYFDTAYMAGRRYDVIERQHRLGLEDISICSQSIDYGIFNTLKNRNRHDIDEMAFIRAMEAMSMAGGQFAVAGISLISRDRLFLGVHKRPVYIVKRQDTADFMIVSDINAAIGLFPQSLIQSTSIKLRKLMTDYSKKTVIIEPEVFSGHPEKKDDWFRQEKMKILHAFQVEIYALDRERTFARIQTVAGKKAVLRHLEIMDFSGRRLTDIRPQKTYLTPVTFLKDFGKTFYEEHLLEIPGLISDLLRRYTCPSTSLPAFDIRTRLLTRRFGDRLGSLNRIILVSTGFSNELAQVVEKTMEPFFENISISVTTPLEISHIESAVSPDRDLVVMISWSGTTADMIDTASLLLSRNILMVGITEKPFSDMGLILKRSVGVIPVFSGEEATVAPLKSTLCMLLVLDLFCLNILAATGQSKKRIPRLIRELTAIPEKVSDILADDAVLDYCRAAAREYMKSDRHYIIDALHHTGSGKLGALNLELNTWTSMGTAVDYSENDAFTTVPVASSSFVMVNATCREQLPEAVHFMRRMADAQIPFCTITTNNRERREIERISRNTVILPKVPDYFQPFIDLPFLFLFGFYFGLARGRLSGQMPRNLAKSVTAGRVKDSSGQKARDLLMELETKNTVIATIPAGLQSPETPRFWTTETGSETEKAYYHDLCRLCRLFYEPDPFSALFPGGKTERTTDIGTYIFDHLSDDGLVIFVPLDKQAEAGCRNFIHLWRLLFDIPLLVEYPEKIKKKQNTDSLIMAVASQPADPERITGLLTAVSDQALVWLGPETGHSVYRAFEQSLGAFHLESSSISCANEMIYLALCQLFTTVITTKFPDRAALLARQFKCFLPAVHTLLDSRSLRTALKRAVDENLAYRKILFITHFKGNCIAWEYRFKSRANRSLESETFGTCTYSRLVLVDPAYESKYIRLESRSRMAQYVDTDTLRELENRYLAGTNIDDFFDRPTPPDDPEAVMPVLIDEQWFLPVLRPNYDTDQDCLVIIDATSETCFDSALDELATFGSRHARLMVIAQEAFIHDSRLSNLKKSPVSHLILLPNIPSPDGRPVAFSDFILPVVMNVIGTAVTFMDDQPDGNPAA